jgi:FAD/FMN-containing dehydrogenase
LTRFAGLAADNLIAVTAVDGLGRIVYANATHNSDLLWASRGAGGGHLAVVTSFHFRTVDVSMGVTAMKAVVPRQDAVEAVYWFQSWQQRLSNKFTLQASGSSQRPAALS